MWPKFMFKNYVNRFQRYGKGVAPPPPSFTEHSLTPLNSTVVIRYDIFSNTPRENKDIGKTWLIKGFYENTKMPSVSYCRMLNTAADTGFHTKGVAGV